MHERDHEPHHIPPPDLPQHKTVLGFRPHIFIGGLVLIVIIIVYLFLFERSRLLAPQPKPATHTSSSFTAPSEAPAVNFV